MTRKEKEDIKSREREEKEERTSERREKMVGRGGGRGGLYTVLFLRQAVFKPVKQTLTSVPHAAEDRTELSLKPPPSIRTHRVSM